MYPQSALCMQTPNLCGARPGHVFTVYRMIELRTCATFSTCEEELMTHSTLNDLTQPQHFRPFLLPSLLSLGSVLEGLVTKQVLA